MLATDGNDIIISGIGALAVVFAALIPAVLLLRGQRDMKATLGKPNSGHDNLADQNQTQLDELAAVRSEQSAHAALDERRFRAVHEHLGIPFDTTQERSP